MRPLPILISFLLIAAPLSGVAASPNPGGEPPAVKLPFGLYWWQNREDIAHSLAGAGTTIAERQRLPDGREQWIVRGFIQPGLDRVLLYYGGEYLDQVELQFTRPDWPPERYTAQFSRLRADLDRYYGEPKLLCDEHQTDPQAITHLVQGYEWKGQETSINLFNFAVQAGDRSYRVVSLHYCYDRPQQITNPDDLLLSAPGADTPAILPAAPPPPEFPTEPIVELPESL